MKAAYWLFALALVLAALISTVGDATGPATTDVTAEGSTAHRAAGRRARRGSEQAAEAVDGVWLEGRVVDREGIAVEGAAVTIDAASTRTILSDGVGVFAVGDLEPGQYRVTARAPGGLAGPVVVEVTADSEPVELVLQPAATLLVRVGDLDGTATIADARVTVGTAMEGRTGEDGTVVFHGVPPGHHKLRAVADGYVDSTMVVPIAASNGDVEIHLRLPTGVVVRGQVRDRDGAAIAGARVSVRLPTADPGAEATSADDGSFALRVAPTPGLRLAAEADGFVPVRSSVLDAEALAAGPVLVLGAGRRISGVVHDGSGEPVPGAIVRGTVPGTDGLSWSTTTAESGAFALDAAPTDTLELVATHATGTSEKSEVRGGERDLDGVELVLADAGHIRGVVRDPDGEPLANAVVVASPDAKGRMKAGIAWLAGDVREATTDHAGAFALEDLRPGRYVLRTQTSVGSADELGARRGTGVDTGSTGVVLIHGDGGKIRGRLVRADGEPVTRFQLRLDVARLREIADVEGRFELTGVDAGAHHLAVDAPGIAGLLLDDLDVTEGSILELGTIVADAGRTITGRVVDADGAPVAGATVFVGDRVVTDAGGTVPLSRGGEGSYDATVTGTDGGFQLAGVDPGRQTVCATHPEHGRSSGVELGETLDDVVLQLGGRAAIAGVVSGTHGPHGGAVVEIVATEATRAPWFVTTGPDGRFEQGQLPAGTYRVTAKTAASPEHQHADTATVVVASDAREELALVLGGGTARLEIAFVDPSVMRDVTATVLVTTAEVVAEDAAGLEAATASTAGRSASAIALGGASVTLEGLEAGRGTVCITWASGDLDDPAAIRRIALGAAALPVTCESVELLAGATVRLAMEP